MSNTEQPQYLSEQPQYMMEQPQYMMEQPQYVSEQPQYEEFQPQYEEFQDENEGSQYQNDTPQSDLNIQALCLAAYPNGIILPLINNSIEDFNNILNETDYNTTIFVIILLILLLIFINKDRIALLPFKYN